MSADGKRWYLIDASPDLGQQIEATWELRPVKLRESKIHAVLLTHAHPDHVLGLPTLGLGGAVAGGGNTLIYSSKRTREYLLERNSILGEGIGEDNWIEISPNQPEEIMGGDGRPSELIFEAFDVPHRPISSKARGFDEESRGDTVGYRITERHTGKALAYVPDIREITSLALRKIDGVDALLFDGTFYTDDELIRLGISSKTSRELGHVPMAGSGGSIESLRDLTIEQKFYTHINNTNPVILVDSRERKQLRDGEFKVAEDGERIDP